MQKLNIASSLELVQYGKSRPSPIGFDACLTLICGVTSYDSKFHRPRVWISSPKEDSHKQFSTIPISRL